MNPKYRLLSWSLVIGLACLFPLHVPGQISSYTFMQSTQAFAQSTTGTRLGSASDMGHRSFLDPGQPEGSTSQTKGPGFPIGFNFIYQGVSFDRFGILNNGWICLGHSKYGNAAVDIGQFGYQPLELTGPLNDTLRARIVAFDANLARNSSSSSLSFETIGESPEQTLIVKWKRFKLTQPFGTNNTNVNFEIRLNELDGSVDIRYGEMLSSGYVSISSCNVGLGGFSRLDFNNRKTPASKDWNSTVAGTTFLDDCIFQSTSILPEYGLNFHWSPSVCPSIPVVKRDYVTNQTIQLSWAASEAINNPQYEYALTTSALPPASGTTTNATSRSFTGLIPSTLYYFHLKLHCPVNLTSTWTTHMVKTRCNPLTPPYFENFDGVSAPAIPPCMSILNNSIETQTWVTAEEVGLSGPNGLNIPYEAFFDNDDWVFLPGLILQKDTNYLLSLDYYSFNLDTLRIYAGKYPDPDSMVQVGYFPPLSESYYGENYLTYAPPSNGEYFIGIRSFGADMTIDNIVFKKNNCPIPSNIHLASNLLNHSVVKWNTSVPGTNYQYSITPYETYPPQGVESTNLDSVIFDALDPSMTYHFYLRTDCGAGIFSPWTEFIFDSKSDYDECANAREIIPNTQPECDGESFSTKGATASSTSSSACEGYADDDIWIKFTALYRSHSIRLMNSCLGPGGGGTFTARSATLPPCQPLIMEVRSGTCGANVITCKEIPSGQTRLLDLVNLTPGSTYYIRVFGKDTLILGQNFSMCVGSYPTETNSSCAAATLLSVSTGSCPTGNEKNLAGAISATLPVSTCDSGPYYSLWYKVVATATTHILEASFTNNVDGVIDAFGGTCGSLTNLGCANQTISGSEQLTLTGLTIGQTIWIHVFDAGNTGAASFVSMCVRVPAANDQCANATNIPVTNGITLANPINANSFTASGQDSCSSFRADDDLWFKFTATSTSHLAVAIPVSPSPQMTTPVIEFFPSGCAGMSAGCSNTGEYLMTSLTIGTVYYFKIYSATNLTGRGNFRVGVTTPPSNFSCATALPIPVNTNQTCTLSLSGTSIGTGVKNEVWYSFVATQASMEIVQTGTIVLDMAVHDGCNGTFLAGDDYSGVVYFKNYIPGHTYYLKIYAPVFPNLNYQYFQSDHNICIIPSPANDECTSPIQIHTQTLCDVYTAGSTFGSTPSVNSGSCFPGIYDTWYTFTATSTHHKILIDPDPGYTYVSAQVFKGSCFAEPIVCFGETFGTPNGVAILDNLEIDSTYSIRVSISSPNGPTGSFTMCISSPPVNDHCLYATEITAALTNTCSNSLPGTTINATNTFSHQNVWYKFTAASRNVTIVVTPTTAGFDPEIVLWNPTTGMSLENCVFDKEITINDTHADFQPEILSLADLVIGNTYFIEIYPNTSINIPGDFEICMFSPEDKMTVYSAVTETYPFDTLVSAGTWNQPVTKVTLQLTGRQFNKVIRRIRFDASGSTDMNDVLSASVFIDTKIWGFHNGAILPYRPFGKVGEGLAEYPAPFKFGETIDHPGNLMTFNGEYIIQGEKYGSTILGSDNYPRFLYLVMEIACDADPGHVIQAVCNSIQFDIDSIVPLELSSTLGS